MWTIIIFLLQCIVRTNETCVYGEQKENKQKQQKNKAKPVIFCWASPIDSKFKTNWMIKVKQTKKKHFSKLCF